MIRLLVCGGRDYINERRVYEVLAEYKTQVSVLIHGAARGADFIAGQWAIVNNIPELPFKVTKSQWEQYGKAAGHRRNTRMFVEGKPDLVIAFPGGPGTANMVRQARAANVQVIEIKEE